jgi:DNA-binding NarL/FixJ family response regulator
MNEQGLPPPPGDDHHDGPIKVLIVDDHPLIREGLHAILAGRPEIEIVGASSTAEDAVELVARHQPAVVLMDFQLRGRTGAEAAVAIRASKSDTSIVFLSADDSEETLSTAIRAGAIGYLPRTATAEEILDAVHRAAAGQILIPTQVLAGLLATERSRTAAAGEVGYLIASITSRERQVLQLTAQGLGTADIAAELSIELSTVRWHVKNILEKLGVHSKLAAVARAAEYGLIQGRSRG